MMRYPFYNQYARPLGAAAGVPAPYYGYGARAQHAQPFDNRGGRFTSHLSGGPPRSVFYPASQNAIASSGSNAVSEAVHDGAAAGQDGSWTPATKLKRGRRLAQFLAQRAVATQPSTGLEAAGVLAQQLGSTILQSRLDKREERNNEISRRIMAAANAEPDPEKRAEILRNSPDPELRALADYENRGFYLTGRYF